MKASSLEWQNFIAEDKRNFTVKADITLANSTVLNLDSSKIMTNGLSYSSGTSENGVFSIGGAVSAKTTILINNMYGEFGSYDFTGAVVRPYIGLILSETTEWLKLGVYTVETPTYSGSIISLELLDNLAKADKTYVPTVTFPCTQLALIQDVCTQSGIYFNSSTFHGYNTSVSAFDYSTLTCRQIIAYACQINCLYAYCDENGYLNFTWYKQDILDRYRASLDGGTFSTGSTPYSDGDTADGGNFTDYSGGYVADGGTFLEMNDYAVIYSISTQDIMTDDVVITGVKITYAYSDEEDRSLQVGTDGYVISIDSNPLINKNNVSTVANYIYSIIGGLEFRPLTISALSDPRIEAGDIGLVIDAKQNVYPTIFTNISFTVGNYETYTCDAETPARNSTEKYSASTAAIVKARENAAKQISTYDEAVQRLTSLMTNSFGMYKTVVVQEDGSSIFYMHNKSTLAESSTIWRMTADAFGVSTDGGLTYPDGFDSEGNAVYNVLTAIGINAEWINAGSLIVGGTSGNVDGTITVKDGSGSTVFSSSKNGLIINTPNLTVGSDTISMKGNINAEALYVKKEGFLYATNDLEYVRFLLAKSDGWTSGAHNVWMGTDLTDEGFDENSSFARFSSYSNTLIGSKQGTYIELLSTEYVIIGDLEYGFNTGLSVVGETITHVLRPAVNNSSSCGTSEHKWTTVYATNGTIQTSDRNKKHNIQEILPIYETMFMKTITVQYMFNDGDRVHFGVVSQDFEELLAELSLTDLDCAAFCKDIHYVYEKDEKGRDIESTKTPQLDENGEIVYDYAFRYSEFIMLTVHMVQKTILRVDKHDERLNDNDKEIIELQSTVESQRNEIILQQETLTNQQQDIELLQEENIKLKESQEQQAKLIQALCEKVGVAYGNSNA